MSGTRNGAMTTVGILNIVLGAIGALASLLMILGGGLLAIGSASIESGGDPDLAGVGAIGTLGGMIVVVMGIVSAIFGGLLLFSGVGVLKVRPWGRTLCIISGLGLFGLNGLSILGEFSIINLIMLGYGGLITVLCFTQDWRNRFAGLPSDEHSFAGGSESLDAPIGGYAPPSFPVIPAADPAAAPSRPSPTTSLHPAPAVARGKGQGQADAGAFTGLPGMPPPPAQPVPRFNQNAPAPKAAPSGGANRNANPDDDNDYISEVAA
jgi:hypothetical protein